MSLRGGFLPMEERVMSMNRTICVYGEQQQQQKEGRSRREEKTMPVHWVSGTPSTQVAVPVHTLLRVANLRYHACIEKLLNGTMA